MHASSNRVLRRLLDQLLLLLPYVLDASVNAMSL